jgi:hypothetical protein
VTPTVASASTIFFCHANTWQSVLLRLVKSTEVVLMDLRSFAQSNAGCVFEIKELLNTVPLQRLAFVVDGTTDKTFLMRTLEESRSELRFNSPNRELSCPRCSRSSFNLSGTASCSVS